MFCSEILLFPSGENGNAAVDRLVQDLPATLGENGVVASSQIVPYNSCRSRRREVYDVEEFGVQCGLLSSCAFRSESFDMLGQVGRVR